MKPMIPKRTRRLRARAAAINTNDSEFEDYGPEPNMKLSHAFLVVLLLHVIAIGGIYAFTSFNKAGKTTRLEVARTASPAGQTSGSSNPSGPSGAQDPKPEDPKTPPPSGAKPPVVAKTSEAPQVAEKPPGTSASEIVRSEAHQGLLSNLKAALLRFTGQGATAGAVTATVATAAAQVSTNTEAPAQPVAAASPTPLPGSYVVKSGDTITKISALLGVTILDLEKVNGLEGSSVLQVGETLKVPTRDMSVVASGVAGATAQTVAAAPAANPLPVTSAESATAPVDTTNMADYTVVKGDNPYKIAKKFKISTEELMKANGITDPKKIQIGQKLKIPSSTRTSKNTKKGA